MVAADLRDCYMCAKKEEIKDRNGLTSLYCGSDNLKHKKLFTLNGRFAAPLCDGFLDIYDKEAEDYEKNKSLLSNDKALPFLLAGKCEFTMVSGKTGISFSYKLSKKESKLETTDYIYFLNIMENKQSKYAGIIFFDAKDNKFVFRKGKKGQLDNSDVKIKSILYVLNNLFNENYGLNVKIYHIGRCGRCGKKLTTPESILTGLGPECSKLCGIPRVKLN